MSEFNSSSTTFVPPKSDLPASHPVGFSEGTGTSSFGQAPTFTNTWDNTRPIGTSGSTAYDSSRPIDTTNSFGTGSSAFTSQPSTYSNTSVAGSTAPVVAPASGTFYDARDDTSSMSSVSTNQPSTVPTTYTNPQQTAVNVAPRPDFATSTMSVPVQQSKITATGAPDVTGRCDPLPPSEPLIPTMASKVTDPTSMAHPYNSSYEGVSNVQATSAPAHPFYLGKDTNAALVANSGTKSSFSEMKIGDNSGPQYNSTTDRHYPTTSVDNAYDSAATNPSDVTYLNNGREAMGTGYNTQGSALPAAGAVGTAAALDRTSPTSSMTNSTAEPGEKKNSFLNATMIHETKVPSHPLPDPTRYGPAPTDFPALVQEAPLNPSAPRQVIQTSSGALPLATDASRPEDSYIVHLSHADGAPLGMNIVSDDLNFTGVYITEVDPFGIAAQTGRISRGLFIQAVNGKSTVEMKHKDILRELKEAEVDLMLSLHPFEKRASIIAPALGSVPVEGTSSNVEPQAFSGERNIVIEKDAADQLGLTLQGVRGVIVSAITRGSPASRSTIQVDDKLISVNGVNVVNATIEEIVTLFRQSPRVLTLTVLTPVTKRISAFGVLSGPKLAKGAMREDELEFAGALDRSRQTVPLGDSVIGSNSVTGDAPATNTTTSDSYVAPSNTYNTPSSSSYVAPVAGSTVPMSSTYQPTTTDNLSSNLQNTHLSSQPMGTSTYSSQPMTSTYSSQPLGTSSSYQSSQPLGTSSSDTLTRPLVTDSIAKDGSYVHIDPVTGVKTYGC